VYYFFNKCAYLQSDMKLGRFYFIFILVLGIGTIPSYSQQLVATTGRSISNATHLVDFSIGEIAVNFLANSNAIFTIGMIQPSVILPILPKIDTVVPKTDNTLLVYQFVSPNNDGKNETFYVNGLELYPENEVIIMDRTGKVVFDKKNYRNDWVGDNLPEDNYFYVVKIPALNSVLKGGFVLAR
jgi:gliding motility-associated-like protein